MLLDSSELSAGTWYIAVINAEEATAALKYRLSVELLAELDCPTSPSTPNAVCSGKGQCDRSMGRCHCDVGYTLDDCSADGVSQRPPAITPEVQSGEPNFSSWC